MDFLWLSIMVVFTMLRSVHGTSGWSNAHATFYGGGDASGTIKGACGYINVFKEGYGIHTAALSKALFNDGKTCGACYEIKCVNDPEWCLPGSITITATNLCPPNPSLPSNNGGWCNEPLKHFDLSQPVYEKIAKYKSGIIPIEYRRVVCRKKGGIRFTMVPINQDYLILITNVAGAGDVVAATVKGSKTGWQSMSRNWGQNWHTPTNMKGQSMSIKVTASNGLSVMSKNVIPSDWQFWKTYTGNQFKSNPYKHL